jgi:uncharacterized protein YdeI (YjbR/CyaY-like superfamily)
MATKATKPTFFATPAAFRKWLTANQTRVDELLVGFYKVGSGKPSITWPESVDQALCFGWIDGVRRSLGADAYSIRFTPRRARSIWSGVNTRRYGELEQAGQIAPAGKLAFAARDPKRSGVYSFEQRKASKLAPEEQAAFEAKAKAWAYFQAQAPWYQRTTLHWVVSAKRPETRARRLATLIADCAAGRPIKGLIRPAKP